MRLDTPRSGRPALLKPGVFTNYAVGRARARSNAAEFPFYDLTTQVNLFLSNFGGRAAGDATYIVWIGANDVRDALIALSTDPTGATSVGIIGAALHSIGDNIVTLWASGARTFLIPNAPDLSIVPAIQALGPAAVGAASQLTAAYNQGLEQVLSQVQLLPGAHFTRLDDFTLLDRIVANPRAFRLDEVVLPCLTFGVVVEAVCEEPEDYLFWDGVHPTTAGHGILARGAQRALTADGVIDD